MIIASSLVSCSSCLKGNYSSLTHSRMNCFSVEVTFSLYMNETYHIPSSVGFSAPKLHTSALTAILYTFVTQTTPTH